MIGLSPLPQGHPDPFQRKTVRPSSACHGAFSLAGGRSQSFASAAADSYALFGHAFAPGPGLQALALAGDERLVGSLCKRHAVTPHGGSDRLRAHGFRVSFTPLSAVLFTFPSRYCALSVSRECLALADGAAGFGQGSSDPALLRVQARLARVPRTGLSPAPARLSRRLPLCGLLPLCRPYYPARASTPAVWAVPLSLAATRGVTVVFLSSDYWDVSVRRVRLPIRGCRACARRVAPFGHPRIWGCSRLPAVFRGLPRPSSPPGAKASSVRPRSLLALREFPRRARAPAGSLSFVVSFSLCVCFPSNPVKEPCGSGIAAVSRRSGECGARTHDPRLAKPVL